MNRKIQKQERAPDRKLRRALASPGVFEDLGGWVGLDENAPGPARPPIE
jgi:hypothetical protein